MAVWKALSSLPFPPLHSPQFLPSLSFPSFSLPLPLEVGLLNAAVGLGA